MRICMKLFKPDYYVKNFDCVCIDRLKNQGIKVLLCDIDNTLVAYDEVKPSERVLQFFHRVESNGIKVALCSNAPKERAMRFSADLPGIQTYWFSCKPFPFCFWKVKREFHVQAKEIALIGDQIYTDILGGNFSGLYTILSDPIAIKDRKITKIFRVFEKLVYYHLEKRNELNRGEYDD